MTVSPRMPVYGTGRTDRPAVHSGGGGAGGRGVSGLGSSRPTIPNTPFISLHDTSDDRAARDAD